MLSLLSFFLDLPNHAAGGSSRTCDQLATVSGLTNTAQCTGTNTDSSQTWAAITNQMASYGCCGTEKKSACWVDISAAVCKDPSSYLPDHVAGGSTTCDGLSQSYGFTTTAQCSADSYSEGASSSWAALTNMMAMQYGCCGAEKKSACWTDVSAGICKDPKDYDGSIVIRGGPPSRGAPETTCNTYAAAYKFTGTPQCTGNSGQSSPNGEMSWKELTDTMGMPAGTYNYGCCGKTGKSACSGAAGGDYISCPAADETAFRTCSEKVREKYPDLRRNRQDKEMCMPYQKMFACYPACYCNSAHTNKMIDEQLESLKETVGGDCTLKCGMDESDMNSPSGAGDLNLNSGDM